MAEALTDKGIAEIVKLGRLTGAPQKPDGANTSFVVIPSDCKIEDLGKFIHNDYADRPIRAKANVGVLDPESFVEYYTLFSDENSRVFAYEPEIKVTGVLDYHAAGAGNAPRWCQHRVTLTLRQSEEWKIWISKNNKQFTQMEFAEFLEQNSIDIVKPQPTHMLEVARDLEATTEVEFGSGSRTQDGQVRFRYTETTKATVGGGQLQVPEQFVISIPAFVGGQRVDMQALLRFRVKEGKLVLWYTLVRPEEVLRTAFIGARDHIADSLKVTIINGTPA